MSTRFRSHERRHVSPRHVVLLGLALLASVASNGRNPAACGPFLPEAMFTYTLHPDLPMEAFARGRLGIVQPTYARSYLVVAYRHLSGLPVADDEAQAMVRLWDSRLGRVASSSSASSASSPSSSASSAQAVKPWNERGPFVWRAARKTVGVTTELAYATEREVPGAQYQWYANISDAAFEHAAETLKARVAQFGKESALVRDWVIAQDLVFTADKGVPAGLVPLGAEAPALARADRAYQIAAAHFYAGSFARARELFQAIARDADSPWRSLAPYLAARCLLRLGTVGAGSTQNPQAAPADANTQTRSSTTPVEAERALTQAIEELTAIAANEATPAHLRESSRGLVPWADHWRALVVTDQGKMTAIEEAARTVLLQAPGESIGVALDGFTRLLDRRLQILQAAAANASSNTTPAAPSVSAPSPASASASATWSASNAPAAANSPADLLEWLTLFQSANDAIAEARTPFAEPDAQVRAADARDRTAILALDRWRQRQSLPWLVAVLTHARPQTPGLADALSAAEGVDERSPAYATLAFHRARLQLESGDPPGSRTLLDRALTIGSAAPAPAPAQSSSGRANANTASRTDTLMPQSALNDLRTLRLQTARSLEEFLTDGAKPSVSARITGTEFELGLQAIDESQEAPAAASTRLRRTGTRMFDTDAAEGLNRMPLRTLIAAAESATLPPHLQYDLLVAAWTRAALLGEDALGARIAPRLRQLAPVLAQDLDAYLATSSPDARRAAAVWTLLHHPGLSPIVRPGYARPEPLQTRDPLHDNWWCGPRLSYAEYAPSFYSPAPIWPGGDDGPAFLSTTDRAQAARELDALKPASATWLARETVAWARRQPDDPRLPEALHLAVLSARFGCTDPASGAASREAFNLLHTRFPSSPWAKRTRYWYK